MRFFKTHMAVHPETWNSWPLWERVKARVGMFFKRTRIDLNKIVERGKLIVFNYAQLHIEPIKFNYTRWYDHDQTVEALAREWARIHLYGEIVASAEKRQGSISGITNIS